MTKQDIDGNQNIVSGRDSIINQYALNNELILEGITKKLGDIDTKLKEIIPLGIYNRNNEIPEAFESQKLLTSLLEIAIPIPVAFDLIESVPEKVNSILRVNMQKKISTTDIRRIIYAGICSMDYSKFGTQIEKWGENYARKYGNPDIQVMVQKAEGILVPLDYTLILKELLPDLLIKCYGENLFHDLNISEYKNVLNQCAGEIMEKIKNLNIYTIRYSTLHKISYDLATQPPHPWFTNAQLKTQHRTYHIEKAEKHYNNLNQDFDFVHSLKECIEHTCSILLTQYSLFVGTGRLRPLHMLLIYLEQETLDNGNILIWERTELAKLKGDLMASRPDFNINKFKILLSTIRSKCIHLDRYNKVENRKEIVAHVNELYDIIKRIYLNYDELDKYPQTVGTMEELISRTVFLLSHVEGINFNREKFFFKHHCQSEIFSNIKHRIRLGFVHKVKHQVSYRLSEECDYCDTILYISNISLEESDKSELKEQTHNYNLILIELNHLSQCVSNIHRYSTLVQVISENFI